VNPRRSALIDVLLIITVAVLAAAAFYGLFGNGTDISLTTLALLGFLVLSGALVAARFANRPDHVRAIQSAVILDIARASIEHLRQGLTPESAQAVCRIALAESAAAAVAITDTKRVLGFAGLGEDHHAIGGPIITRATIETIEANETRILPTQAEIGCPKRDCLLRAAIVVPLEMRGQAVGTLKFYYTTPRLLNETQVTMAEGLAALLSSQLELSELERQTELATRMELKALQAQINPHFLFNTLNTIASLIRTDPPRARELLRQFATFYRRTLASGDELIPLERELEYLHSYLIFEVARFGDMLDFAEDVPGPLRAVQVPAFVVQPLVENAVAHGRKAEGTLHVRLTAFAEDGDVVIAIVDDGVGIPEAVLPRVLEPGFGKGLGIALKNVDDRLKGHFGPRSGVSVASVEGEGATVTLRLADAAPPADAATTGEGTAAPEGDG